MRFNDLLGMDIKCASVAVCKMSSEEMDTLCDSVMKMDINSRCFYAKLCACRGESLRLISLITDGELVLCRLCVKLMKKTNLRKDLISKLSSDEEFLDLFNSSCNSVKQILLESLTWNKSRDTGCLADRLYDCDSLQLNSKQRSMLANACSLEKFVDIDDGSIPFKKYYALRKRELQAIALLKIRDICKDAEKEDEDCIKECDKLVHFIYSIWGSIDDNGTPVRICDIILDAASVLLSSDSLIETFINEVNNPNENVIDRKGVILYAFQETKLTRLSSISSCYSAIIKLCPIYVLKRIDFISKYTAEFEHKNYYHLSFKGVVYLLQNAQFVGDIALRTKLISYLASKDTMFYTNDISINKEDVSLLDSVLSADEFSSFIMQLLDNVLEAVRKIDRSEGIFYNTITSIIYYLTLKVDHHSEKLQTLLSIYAEFEKEYVSHDVSQLIAFYGMQTKEIPLDFNYHMATKCIYESYTTVHKFESVLCLKGNTFLNTKDADARMKVLNQLLHFAAESHDVRAIHRCLTVYSRIELKSSDITFNLDDHCDLFSPDALGMSALSLLCSESEEVATIARMNVVNTILEWANSKKGDMMVSQLITVLCYLYTYCSIYSEYEEQYCTMMKPIVSFLVNKKLKWNLDIIKSSTKGYVIRKSHYVNTSRHSMLSLYSSKSKHITHYINSERFCMGLISSVPTYSMIPSNKILTPDIHTVTSDKCMPSISKKGLLTVLETLVTMGTDVDIEAVAAVLTCLIRFTIDTDVDSLKTEEEIQQLDKKSIWKVTVETIKSGDMEVLRELVEDRSIEWDGCYCELSVVQSLLLLTKNLNDCKKYLCGDVITPVVSVAIRDNTLKPMPSDGHDVLFNKLDKNTPARRAFLLSHSANTVNMEIASRVQQALKAVDHLRNTVDNLSISENSLKWCIDNVSICDMSPLLSQGGDISDVIVRKTIEIVSDSTLISLFDLASLYAHVMLQGMLIVVALNRSDKPVNCTSLVMQQEILKTELYEIIPILLQINRLCVYRGLQCNNKMCNIITHTDYLFNWLTAVQNKQVLSVKAMQMEDTVPFSSLKAQSVSVDFSDNVVVGRLLELSVYSRTIKEFFGKSLKGLVPVMLQMDTSAALMICRRLLLVSTFVPLAETVMKILLAPVTGQSLVATSIVDMLLESMNALSVAFIGLVFRLSSLPELKSQYERLHGLISGIIDHVMTQDFKSVDVYFILTRWLLTSALTNDDVDAEYLHNLCGRLSKLTVTEEAGCSMFYFVVTLVDLFDDVSCIDEVSFKWRPKSNPILDSLQYLYDEADEMKQELFEELVKEIICGFDTTAVNEASALQMMVLTVIDIEEIPECLLNKCNDVIQAVWDPSRNKETVDIACIAFLCKYRPELAVEIYEKMYVIWLKLVSMKRRQDKIIDLPEFLELEIPEEFHSYLDNNELYLNVRGLLYSSSDLFPEWRLIRFLASLSGMHGDMEALHVYAVALSMALKEDEFEEIEDAEIDLPVLVDELSKTIQPWMYHSLHENGSVLFKVSEDVVRELIDMFENKKNTVVAFLLEMSQCEESEDEFERNIKLMHDWIDVEGINDLLFLL